MFKYDLHHLIQSRFEKYFPSPSLGDQAFLIRFAANISDIHAIYGRLYGKSETVTEDFGRLVDIVFDAYNLRDLSFKKLDQAKSGSIPWFISEDIVGMSLYVDRFCGKLSQLPKRLDYLQDLGVNFLHLMPLMESPEGASDGGYAVSDFRKVDTKYGTNSDLIALVKVLKEKNIHLMLDMVINHTSDAHEWAMKAKNGDQQFKDYYYMFEDRSVPDRFEETMPDIFPENAPGSFTFDSTSGKWVMTVFNKYQWDLNYRNPAVLAVMLDTIFYYANLGVDILRIDAPAFIWKKLGTPCQNLPEAHELLQLIKLCVKVATPGMALLGEAIVAPKEIIKYFGKDRYYGNECDVAYNATQMATQWDALATADTRIMQNVQQDLMMKPYGCTWINYTRCHDDIGLGFGDEEIEMSGYSPANHRSFLKDYYIGNFNGSIAKGVLFGVNPKNNDARISGSLASLVGLEYAIDSKEQALVKTSIDKVILMQATSIFLAGIPMIYYGDEAGYINDYSYLRDPSKLDDNRWMHRPIINWKYNDKVHDIKTIQSKIFQDTKRLINMRKSHPIFADINNTTIIDLGDKRLFCYERAYENMRILFIFNYSNHEIKYPMSSIRNKENLDFDAKDLWSEEMIICGADSSLVFAPYSFKVVEYNI